MSAPKQVHTSPVTTRTLLPILIHCQQISNSSFSTAAFRPALHQLTNYILLNMYGYLNTRGLQLSYMQLYILVPICFLNVKYDILLHAVKIWILEGSQKNPEGTHTDTGRIWQGIGAAQTTAPPHDFKNSSDLTFSYT